MIKKTAFIIFLIFSWGCPFPGNNSHNPSPDDYSHIKITEVIDGDTVRLSNGKLLRYIGIDTPESRIKKGGKFIDSPQPFSSDATELNRKLVENKFVRIEFDVSKEDKYGRLLGYCFAGDEFVNERLLLEGLAVLYTFPPNVKYADKFILAQKTARENKKGMWTAYETINHDQAYRFINQIRTVKGKVLSAYKSKKCVFLNFGTDHRSDFTVVIFKDSFGSFYQKQIDPANFYTGKTIEVTGRIRKYNGPEIIVNVPEEISITDNGR